MAKAKTKEKGKSTNKTAKQVCYLCKRPDASGALAGEEIRGTVRFICYKCYKERQ